MGAEPGYGEDEDGGAGDPEEAELQAPGEEDALPQGRGQGDRAAEAPRGVSLKLAKAGRIVRANLRRPRVTVAVHFFSTNPLTASSLKTAVFLRVYGNKGVNVLYTLTLYVVQPRSVQQRSAQHW